MNEILLDLNDKLDTLTTTQKLALILVIIMGFSYFMWNSKIPPVQTALVGAQGELVSLESQIAQMKQQLQNIDALQEQLQLAQNSLNNLLVFLPTEMEIPKLLASFSERAKASNVEIKQFTPGTPAIKGENPNAPAAVPADTSAAQPQEGEQASETPAPTPSVSNTPINEIPIKVAVVGYYQGIVQFLDRMMEIPRIIKIDNFVLQTLNNDAVDSVQNQPEDQWTPPKIMIEVDFITYFQGAADLALFSVQRRRDNQRDPVVQQPPTNINNPNSYGPSSSNHPSQSIQEEIGPPLPQHLKKDQWQAYVNKVSL